MSFNWSATTVDSNLSNKNIKYELKSLWQSALDPQERNHIKYSAAVLHGHQMLNHQVFYAGETPPAQMHLVFLQPPILSPPDSSKATQIHRQKIAQSPKIQPSLNFSNNKHASTLSSASAAASASSASSASSAPSHRMILFGLVHPDQ